MPPMPEKNTDINMKERRKKIHMEDYGLFIVRVSMKRSKLIEELMTDEVKQATGLNKLTAQELANLNSWLDPDKLLAGDAAPD
jgi:hypothetical protein